MKPLLLFLVSLALFLTGCSSGGGSSNGTTINQPPTALFELSPVSGNAPLNVSMNARTSTDSDGTISSYAWDYGDGYTGQGITSYHIYTLPGTYTVTLTITDNQGVSAKATHTVTADIYRAEWLGSYQLTTQLAPALHLVTYQDNATTISGNYRDSDSRYGTFSGTQAGTTISFSAVSTVPGCSGNLNGTASILGDPLMTLSFAGTDCQLGTISGTGELLRQTGTVLAFNAPVPQGLVDTGSGLAWYEQSETAIRSVAKSGGSAITLAHRIGVPVQLLLEGDSLFWIDSRSGISPTGCAGSDTWRVLNRTTLSSGHTQQLQMTDSCAIYNNEIVTDGTYLYWVGSTASPQEFTLWRVPASGGSATAFAVRSTPIIALAIDASYLYWEEQSTPSAGTIFRRPLAGGTIETVYPATGTLIPGIALNGGSLVFAESVYDGATPGGVPKLFKVAVSGGSPTLLSTLPLPPLVLRTQGSTIYWMDAQSVQSLPLSGGTPTALASGLNKPQTLWIDSSAAFWTDAPDALSSDATLWSVPLSGGIATAVTTAPQTLIALSGDSNTIYLAQGRSPEQFGQILQVPRSGGTPQLTVGGISAPRGMVYANNYLYIADGWRVKRLPVTGGSPEVIATANFYIDGLDTDGSYVYWVEGPINTIHKAPVAGGTATTLATDPAGTLVSKLLVNNGTIYWLEGLTTIKQMPNTGGSITTLLDNGTAVSDFILDSSWLYFSEQESGQIRRMPKSGGTPTTLATGDVFSWHRLALDADELYWVDQTTVSAVPKAGGASRPLITSPVWMDATVPSALTVDSILKRVYWTETGIGAVKADMP